MYVLVYIRVHGVNVALLGQDYLNEINSFD